MEDCTDQEMTDMQQNGGGDENGGEAGDASFKDDDR